MTELVNSYYIYTLSNDLIMNMNSKKTTATLVEIITKDWNKTTMEEIITKDSNRATIVEIITKDSNKVTMEEI